jgi:hypothetical protein
MSKKMPTKCLVAYRIRRAAVKTGQTTGGLHRIMNLRGLF